MIEGSKLNQYSQSDAAVLALSSSYILESTQKGGLDVTPWLSWFLGCLNRTFDDAETILAKVLGKAEFWREHAQAKINMRQRIINRLLDGFTGKLTSPKYALIEKCSADTALRDITELLEAGVLKKDDGGGRSTSYSLADSVNDRKGYR